MCKRSILTIVAVAIFALAGGLAQAETIPVPNGEFNMYKPGTGYTVLATFPTGGNSYAQGVGNNLRVIGDGIANYSDGTSGAVIDCPGWTKMNAETGGNDLFNNGVDGGVGFNAFGTWSGGRGTMVVSADSLGKIQGGSVYTLSAMVSGPAGPLVLDLLANGVVITPTSSVTPPAGTLGVWEVISRTYDAAAIGNYSGQAMTISLGTRAVAPEVYFGTRVVFDNVSLSYELLFNASAPIPADEETDVSRDVVLSWTAGTFAAAHDVYLGTSFDDVNGATTASAVYKGRQDGTTFAPGRLEFGTTYYWRIDEVNAPPDSTIFKGMIWSFTTELLAYPVARQSITVTASSSEPNQGPENTINDSGLTDDLHSEDLKAMWLSAGSATGPAWIQYEFDRVLRLHEMWVWNHNGLFEPMLGLGSKEVKIEYSTDGNDFKVLGTTHQFARAPGAAGYACNTVVDLGGLAAKYVKLTILSNWGSILKQYGLSEVRFYSVPVFAREPSPTANKTGVDVDSSITWRAGREAAKHVLYVSKTQQAVIDGSVPAQTLTSPTYTPALDLASTYFWRVDEGNDTETPSVWQGNVWSFSTQEYVVVDDFESYTNDSPKRVFQAWIDGAGFSPDEFFPQGNNGNGSGSLVGYDPLAGSIMETATIHAGKKSMPMTYDNTTKTYSEAKRTFDSPQNWALHGIKALTLWFYGDPTNVAQQMYVKINSTKVAYDGAADNLKRKQWQMWYIPLASLNVGSVTSLSIGFDRLGTTGGTGKVLIDDLRLYSYDRQLITPKDPGTVGLQAQYQFEGNANDSSGKARNGTLAGAPTYVADGRSGQAISLDGTDDCVNIAGYKGIVADAAGVQQPFTVCAWIKTATNTRDIIAWGTNAGGQRMNFRVDTVIRVEHGSGNMRGTNGPSLLDNEWHHVAGTVPQGGTLPDTRLYVDGADVSAPASATAAYNLKAGVDVAIGMGGSMATGRFFNGLLDDVRIYDRVLSAEEITWLAGRTMPFDKGF